MTEEREIDPIIEDYVVHVANRFGAPGLEDLIARAQAHLVEAQAALEELSHLDEE